MSDDRKVKGFSNDVGFGGSNAPSLRELPFRIMAVGNFCGANRSEARTATAIDAHDFDKVLAQLWPRAVFEVENLLGTGKALEVDFTPGAIKDFDAANVAARIPALAPVADFIARAKALQAGTLKPGDFKSGLAAIQAVPALREPLDVLLDSIGGAPKADAGPAPTGSDDALAGIFNMVDTGKRETGGSAVDNFAAAVGGGRKGIDAGEAIRAAETVLAKQLAPVLTHPQMTELERNWRGLHLLCKRGKGAKIEVFDGDFDSWQAAVYEREYSGASEAPLAMVLLADPMANTAAGMAALQEWGDAGGQIQCAVVFEAGEDFLGISLAELAKLDAPATLFSESRFDKWRSLRDKDESRWLVAAMNGYRATKTLWGSPVWLIGAAVAQSMQRSGWPASHTGAADGEIEGLPTLAREGTEHPLEALLPDRHLKDLSRAGFTPLMAQPNHDSAWVLLAPTAHAPSKAEEEGKVGSLAYQLTAARIAEAVMRAKGALMTANDAESTVASFEAFLNALLSDTGPGATAMARVNGDRLEIALRTGREVLNGAEFQMALTLS